MQVRILSTPGDFTSYNQWVRSHPHLSLWQSLEWKGYQEALGRKTRLYVAEEGNEVVSSALVVIDRTRLGFSVWEVPRGPLCAEAKNVERRMKNEEYVQKLLEVIVEDAKSDRCMSLYVSPPATLHSSLFTLHSSRLVMPEATRIIDLTQPEEEILMHMKPKGRYNISVAQKHHVRVEHSKDMESFMVLAKHTARRQGFRSVPEEQYRAFLKNLPGSFLLLARLEGVNSPISGLVGVVWGETGTYYYGASDPSYGPKMAPYLLQWEAIKWCKSQGCDRYDLFGIAPPGVVGHPWAGLSQFKEQFGGEVEIYPPEHEIRLRPIAVQVLRWKRRVLG